MSPGLLQSIRLAIVVKTQSWYKGKFTMLNTHVCRHDWWGAGQCVNHKRLVIGRDSTEA
jgi:hypothetical protein